jgi:large subunit ribosomal protein L34e
MRPGKTKSRTFRRVKIRVTKGVSTHYEKRKPGKLTCSSCKKELHGVPRLTPTRFKNLPKSKKRPNRPYGGKLCSSCLRIKLLEGIRSQKDGIV